MKTPNFTISITKKSENDWEYSFNDGNGFHKIGGGVTYDEVTRNIKAWIDASMKHFNANK